MWVIAAVSSVLSRSNAAETVTFWSRCQLAVVKVSAPVTVRSLPASTPGVTVTLPVGSVFSLTV